VAERFGISDAVGGAWIGGTIDTSGSVLGAGALLGETATKISVIVKFSQNAFIGLAAFLLSLWWAMTHGARTERPSARLIWDRFPKFILGFMAASLVFSFVLAPSQVTETRAVLTGLRTAWFAVAFTCVGLETRFRDLIEMEGGRPALAFLAAQTFNILWTFLIAYLLFGGVVFAVPEF
jgi:uncharacterized membrane protein YadS